MVFNKRETDFPSYVYYAQSILHSNSTTYTEFKKRPPGNFNKGTVANKGTTYRN